MPTFSASSQDFGGHFRTLMGAYPHPPPPARVRVKNALGNSVSLDITFIAAPIKPLSSRPAVSKEAGREVELQVTDTLA